MAAVSPDDMLVAAVVILTALVAFIAVLYLNRETEEKKPKVEEEPITEGGTVLVEEGGRVVRRSTRSAVHTQLLAGWPTGTH